MKRLIKLLSANDTGETGSHQVGMLVPKSIAFINFFPSLDPTTFNPDVLLSFTDPHGGGWMFRFIYYNNRFFGGTRNEYRLTRMTKFLRKYGAHAGDGIVLSCSEEGAYFAEVVRDPDGVRELESEPKQDEELVPKKVIDLVFDNEWKLVQSKESGDGQN